MTGSIRNVSTLDLGKKGLGSAKGSGNLGLGETSPFPRPPEKDEHVAVLVREGEAGHHPLKFLRSIRA